MQFLVDLASNNERPWFQAHKAEYERLLKEPLEALCADMADELAKRGVPLPAEFPADHPHADLLRLKDVTVGRELSPDEVFSPDLPRVLAADFAAAVPVMRLLASLPVE